MMAFLLFRMPTVKNEKTSHDRVRLSVSSAVAATLLMSALASEASAADAAADESGGLEEITVTANKLNSQRVLDVPGAVDLEDLERRLTVLDEKLHAVLMSQANDELMLRIRREVDGQLAPYRRKMRAEQLALVERQYVQKRLLEEFGLPRLSLYYLS